VVGLAPPAPVPPAPVAGVGPAPPLTTGGVSSSSLGPCTTISLPQPTTSDQSSADVVTAPPQAFPFVQPSTSRSYAIVTTRAGMLRQGAYPGAMYHLADADRVHAAIDGLTREIAVALPDLDAVIGIRRRGVPLAQELAEGLATPLDRSVSQSEITLKRYDEDLTVLHTQPKMVAELHDLDPTDKTLLLVDDVVFSGKTLLRASSYLMAAGAERIAAAVLCARCAREVPIHADFVAMRLDVGKGHKIDVHTPPYEDDLGVYVSAA
jgi:pyrimidine operon attenuation protein/uracil phosphoribosyltransferase